VKLASVVTIALALATSAAPAARAEKPHRVMSISLCTDELLLDLVPPERITSITYLSRSPSFSYLWPQAAHVKINDALAEEVLAEHPDLVLAGTYTAPVTRTLLRRAGIPMLEVEPANTFDQIRDQTRRVAGALGEAARGEALIKGMDATLAALAATKPKRTIRVAGWDGSHYVPGKGSLFDAILTAAGGTNIAVTTNARDGSFDIEQVLGARPDVLAYGADSAGIPGLVTDSDEHPLILRVYAHRRISYPEALYGCGVPQSADAARDLRVQLLRAMSGGMTPLP
jgi:iron complex transport system substrate-binding protein